MTNRVHSNAQREPLMKVLLERYTKASTVIEFYEKFSLAACGVCQICISYTNHTICHFIPNVVT